jgi:Serine dehydrogenase proteinase
MADPTDAVPPPPPAPPPAKRADPSTTSYVLDFIKELFDEDAFRRAIGEHLAALAAKHGVADYTVLLLLDAQDELSSWHSNRIYTAASAAKREKPILLVLLNLGGSIEAGYLISKTCKRLANGKFVVAIPRKAKSAATLLALGADEIHMGLMSELGPIDPQIGGFPALGMKNALEILTDLACKHPGAATMLGEYLQSKLDLRILGYFERINDSAIQYAERLLAGKSIPGGQTPRSLADHFVNHYKDHGFVIDFDEARELLGESVVKHESTEYTFANAVYESFDLIRLVLDIVLSKDVDLVGRNASAVRVFNRKKDA